MTTSAVIQPAFTPFGAVVARQVSVWPFGARTARLFVLVDPSLPDEQLKQGLLRAMQQGYFASDVYSQTRAVREAALAAHYVLQHHNRDVLPLQQVRAASAVAAVRGGVAFVALAGEAAAFSWHDAALSAQHGLPRLPRPLGLEQDPPITLWRTSLAMEDRLVLVCGAPSRSDCHDTIATVLANTSSTVEAQQQLANSLGAGVQVIGPASPRLHVPHLRLVSNEEKTPTRAPARGHVSPVRLVFSILGVLLLVLVALATVLLAPQPNTLAAHVSGVTPHVAVRLGPSAANVEDMVVGASALYTLDVAEGAVHAFALDALDQQPNPETVLAHDGVPVAIEYLAPAGTLAIVDQSRSVTQIGPDGNSTTEVLPSGAGWQALGALGAGDTGDLLLVDGRAHRLLAYPVVGGGLVDAPAALIEGGSLPFERVAQVFRVADSVVVRLDDGSVHRIGPGGTDQMLTPQPISAMASDRSGGLFLADPLAARIVQTRLDGTVLRELQAPALAGVRAIDVSLDGQRLYALVQSGILVIDVPSV